MARPGVAVDAAVLAAAIGIDRVVEADVRRVVVRNDRARALDGHLRLEGSLVLLFGRPAVVEHLARHGLEAPLYEGARPAHEGGFALGVLGHRNRHLESDDDHSSADTV